MIVSVAVVAHCPTAGVNVYVVVAVLLSAGDHVPVMPLVDVVGRGASTSPEQMFVTGTKEGTTLPDVIFNCTALLISVPKGEVTSQ